METSHKCRHTKHMNLEPSEHHQWSKKWMVWEKKGAYSPSSLENQVLFGEQNQFNNDAWLTSHLLASDYLTGCTSPCHLCPPEIFKHFSYRTGSGVKALTSVELLLINMSISKDHSRSPLPSLIGVFSVRAVNLWTFRTTVYGFIIHCK